MAAGIIRRAGASACVMPVRVAKLCVLACVLALAFTFAFMPASLALAEELGGSAEDSFELNLAMEVNPTIDPDADVRSVMLHVGNDAGEHVAGAGVTFELKGAYAVVAVTPAAADRGPLMRPSGAALTGADGTVILEGLVPGCDYRVIVEAQDHERFENTFTCQGADGERWEVVLAKSGSGGGAGNESGTGSEPGGEDVLNPLPRPLVPWDAESPGHGWWLAVTGDAAMPWVLGAVAVALAAFAAVVFVHRKVHADEA